MVPSVTNIGQQARFPIKLLEMDYLKPFIRAETRTEYSAFNLVTERQHALVRDLITPVLTFQRVEAYQRSVCLVFRFPLTDP